MIPKAITMICSLLTGVLKQIVSLENDVMKVANHLRLESPVIFKLRGQAQES
jgi:hypothetical protein